MRSFLLSIASSFFIAAASSSAQVTITAPRVDPAFAEANRIAYVAPVCPTVCITGTVILQIEIESDGSVTKIKVVSGNPMLTGAAIDAVKQWKYRPLTRNGVVERFSTTIRVPFVKHPCHTR
jgi:protein TonB